MDSAKLFGYVEMAGETIVVVASALWVLSFAWVPYLFAAGAILFAIGRLNVQRTISTDNVTVKRLLRQRTFGVFVLLATAAIMFAPVGYCLGNNMYLTRSSWLTLFVVFVVIEVYTAFRLPNALKNS